MVRHLMLIGYCALLIAGALRVDAQTALKTIDNPGGGKIIYGRVDGATTEAGAMGSILTSLHRQYGDKPQVGKVFQVRGTNSAAVFFTLVKLNQGDAAIAGLIIASPSGTGVDAALLSDDAARFGTSVNPMLAALFAVWHPTADAASAPAQSPAHQQSPVQGLRTYVLPDRSASVSLPPDWTVDPSSGGGTIIAEGPKGEAVALDFPMNAMNSNDPRVQRTMQFAQGAGRNTTYARALYYPYGGDLGKTLVDLMQMRRRMNNLPPLTIQIDSESPASGAAGSRCARLAGHLDLHDGKGAMELNSVFCSGALSPMGQYANLAFNSIVPVAIAGEERATVNAILNSFQVNMAVVNRQAAALAAPAIEQIHAIGRAAAAQAQQAHQMNDLHNQAVESRWDSQDKHNQAFSNYLLDQTVISDNQNSGHATVWNQTADALVKGNPSRFSYVDTPNFWKGVDY
jgi:hypothetical protein